MTRTVVESQTKTVTIGFDEPFCVIGERINPTGRKLLAAQLEAGDFTTVEKDALEQVACGAMVLDVNAGGASIENVWRAASNPDSAIAVNGLVALGGSRVAAVDFGNSASGTADVLYSMNIATGEQRVLYEAAAAFELGSSAYDPVGERLYVPDAGRNEVLELVLEQDGATEVGSIRIAPSIGFPPRAVYRLNMGVSSVGGEG